MSAQHTQGRLQVIGREIYAADGSRIAEDINESKARLVACWNAFDGLDTEQIESMVNVPSFFFKHIELLAQRDELLAALKEVVGLIEMAVPFEGSTVRKARAAIAKVEGGAA